VDTAASTSCPHCGAAAPAGAARCARCGFAFVEQEASRWGRLPRPPSRRLAAGGTALAAAAAVIVLIARDDTAATPELPAPVPAARAEHDLELQFNPPGDDTAAVVCPGPIRHQARTRCEARYANGDTQLLLIGLSERGNLDVEIPYPAQRRPGLELAPRFAKPGRPDS
jgi:hypothetical protein